MNGEGEAPVEGWKVANPNELLAWLAETEGVNGTEVERRESKIELPVVWGAA
jgi:hypothetical protein